MRDYFTVVVFICLVMFFSVIVAVHAEPLCGTPEEAIMHCVTDRPECCPIISTESGVPGELKDGDYE